MLPYSEKATRTLGQNYHCKMITEMVYVALGLGQGSLEADHGCEGCISNTMWLKCTLNVEYYPLTFIGF